MVRRHARSTRVRLMAITAVLALAITGTALAALPRPDLLAPGASVSKGSTPTFKARLTRLPEGGKPYAVFVIVSPSKRTKNGILTNPVYLEKMDEKRRNFQATPAKHTFPSYWLIKGGDYWWQAYLVKCEAGKKSCHHARAPRKLRVG